MPELLNCHYIIVISFCLSVTLYLCLSICSSIFEEKVFEAGNLRDTLVGIQILPKRKLYIAKSSQI